MNLIPLAARIVIKPDPEHKNTRLVIPQQAQKFSDYGEVVAVGPGRRHIDGQIYPLGVKVGDKVIFSRQGAFPFEHDGQRYFSTEIEGVIGIVGQ